VAFFLSLPVRGGSAEMNFSPFSLAYVLRRQCACSSLQISLFFPAIEEIFSLPSFLRSRDARRGRRAEVAFGRVLLP